MEYITLDLYDTFQCLAGACPSTCCAGWKILVDQEDYERFLELEPVQLRQDILANIRSKDGSYYFKNKKDGKCAMLDEDGLCRIQRSTDEKTLCNTCRKYPRLISTLGKRLYISLAASCPVVSDYLVHNNVKWHFYGKNNEKKIFQVQKCIPAKETFELFFQNEEIAQVYYEKQPNHFILISCFEKFVSLILDIILSYHEGNYLIDEFQLFGREIKREDMLVWLEAFLEENKEVWKKVKNNYIKYRFLSRRIEVISENIRDCVLQTEAELFLMRTIAFCRYVTNSEISSQDWCEMMQMVYRFCAHGKKVAVSFHDLILSFFSKDYIWNYILL